MAKRVLNVRIRYTTEFRPADSDGDYDNSPILNEWTWTEDLFCLEERVYTQDRVPEERTISGTGHSHWYNATYEISPHGEEFLERLTIGDSRARTAAGRQGVFVTPLMELWQVQPQCAYPAEPAGGGGQRNPKPIPA